MRVKDGSRERFPTKRVDPSVSKLPRNNTRANVALSRGDPRFRLVTADDVGGKFKVTVCPFNDQGEKGERKTSKPSSIVTEAK